ncbi:MAG: hypothetical protein VXW85_05080 [Candidatus Thermoplasmatota archaeon]|nr:hypothetical protein [Candidatus Thermoplasmatota archaeon]MEC7461705.1 hypothetical protein [Candidatus Thermoplasmatota archaeon]
MLPPQGALAFHVFRRPSARGRPVGGDEIQLRHASEAWVLDA